MKDHKMTSLELMNPPKKLENDAMNGIEHAFAQTDAALKRDCTAFICPTLYRAVFTAGQVDWSKIRVILSGFCGTVEMENDDELLPMPGN